MINTRELLDASRMRGAVGRLERSPSLAVCCVTVIYFVATAALASKKQFWNDDLFTFYISRRPTFADIWQALLTGAEQIPPLFFLITRAFTRVFGDGLLPMRLPEMLGFWLMCASLFYFVRRRSSTAHGLAAMLLPMLAGSFYYSYEARPYGLVLGFSGLALVCWQMAAEEPTRPLALAGISLSLAAAISCHYYAILSFIPFIIGELVRTIVRRRLDLPIWIALLSGLLPLALFLPLIKAAKGYSGTFWAKPHWMAAVSFYQDLLGPAVVPVFAVPVIVAFYSFAARRERGIRARNAHSFPLHELAAASGFVLVPVVGVILAKSITGAFTERYALSAIIGVSILLNWSIYAVVDQSSYVALLVAAGIATLFALNAVNTYRQLAWGVDEKMMTYNFLRLQGANGLPLVIAGPHLFFEFSHRAAQHHDQINFVYLADAALARRYTETDDVERGLLALRQWAPLDVQDFHLFCASHKEFLVYGYSEPFSWVIQELLNEGRPLRATAHNGGHLLFVAMPESNH